MIQNIEISKINPHYDNPRKELGDLTELAESIKNSGIFQNLTVVPWFSKITGVGCDDPKQQEGMGYIVVIGHRRLAAAKLAGLTEVPCAISSMNYREQIATMLLENMQRSDLTVYEQATGFQMMLDLGESVTGICEKTGFSETTVRRRVKLLDLDKDKFKKSIERGATLMDYVELEKIKDIETRNKVLESIGTSNFKWNMQNAVDQEKSAESKALIIEELEKFATKIEDAFGLRWVAAYYKPSDVIAPADARDVEYFFATPKYGSITLYKKIDDEEISKQTEVDKKREELKECRAALDELSKQAYQLRSNFVKEISNFTALKHMPIIIEYLLRAMLEDSCCGAGLEKFAQFLDIKPTEFDDIKSRVNEQPERHLLIETYLTIDSAQETYYDWNGRYGDNEYLNMAYDFLKELGYEMSDEEAALRYGTHELF